MHVPFPDTGARAAADQARAAQAEIDELWPYNSLPEHIDPRILEKLRVQSGVQLHTDHPVRGGREGAGDRHLWWAGRGWRLGVATTAELVRLTQMTAPRQRNFPVVTCDQCGDEGITACLVTAHGRDLVGLSLCGDCLAVWDRDPADRTSRRYAAGPWRRPLRSGYVIHRRDPLEDR